jgi:hypothetical protein
MSFFFLIYKIRGGQHRSCLEGWYQWDMEGGGERVWESEYGANSVYSRMKMEK